MRPAVVSDNWPLVTIAFNLAVSNCPSESINSMLAKSSCCFATLAVSAAKLANAAANEQMSAAASARVFMNAQAEAKRFDQQVQAGKKQFDFMAAYGAYGAVITDSFKQSEVAATGFFAKLKAGVGSLKASISQLSALSKVMLGFNVALIGFQVVSGIINHFIQKEEEAYQAAQKAAQE